MSENYIRWCSIEGCCEEAYTLVQQKKAPPLLVCFNCLSAWKTLIFQSRYGSHSADGGIVQEKQYSKQKKVNIAENITQCGKQPLQDK